MALRFHHDGRVCWAYRLPRDVAQRVGRASITRNLRTRDPARLKPLAEILGAGATLLEARLDDPDLSITESTYILRRFHAWCSSAIDGWAPARDADIGSAFRGGSTSVVVDEVMRALRDNAADSLTYSQALETFLKGAMNQILENAKRPIAVPSATAPATTRSDSSAARTVLSARSQTIGLKLSELRDAFLEERSRVSSRRTIYYYRHQISIFIDLVGDLDASEVSRAHVRRYKEMLMKLPVHRGRRFPGVSAARLVESEPDAPRISASALNNYLYSITSFFSWAYDNGYVDANPALGIAIRKARQIPGVREELSREDLRLIFEKGSVHTGCKSESRPLTPGDKIVRNHYFWFPLIALFSGMRLGEIASLRPNDVSRIDGVLCFDLRENFGRRHKTPQSARIVPVHPQLLRIGFEAYTESVRAKGENHLWPGQTKDMWGCYGTNFTKFWIGYRTRLGITGPSKPFYSFRHTFITALKRQGVSPEITCELVGHRMGIEAYRRYAKMSKPATLLESVRRIDYGLDLSHLYVV